MTPNNRLETFLAMISGREDVEPIMPMTRFEYWLNEIATAKGGNPWKDTDGKFVAKRISYTSDVERVAYSITIDSGVKEIPYPAYNIAGRINGIPLESTQNQYSAGDARFFEKEFSDGEVLPAVILGSNELELYADPTYKVFSGDSGIVFGNGCMALLVKEGKDSTIKIQLLLDFIDELNDDKYEDADKLIFDEVTIEFIEEDGGLVK